MDDNLSLVPATLASTDMTLTSNDIAAELEWLVDNRPTFESAVSSENLPDSYYQQSSVPATRQYSGVPTLTSDGRVNPAWLEQLATGVPAAYQTPQGQYGDASVEYNMGLIKRLLNDPENGSGEFLTALYETDYTAFETLVRKVLGQYRGSAEELGLPEEGVVLDQEDYLQIPPHLRETIMSLPQEVVDELMLSDERARNYQLESYLELQQRRAAEQQQWRVAVNDAQVSGEQSIQWLSSQYEQAHWNELRKWRPCNSEEENERARYGVLQGAYGELRSDPRYDNMFYTAHQLLSNAPMKRLNGQSWEADDDEAVALQLAQDFNRALGGLIEKYINVFGRGGSSRGAPISSAGAPPTLTKDGKVNPAWLNWLARKAA